MQHKVFERYLRLGSLADKDRECEHFGFSLAEMLIVLLIMSFIAISIPLIHFKKTELKTKRSLHGRFECFYDETGTLKQYSKNEEGATLIPLGNATECVFTPPKNAVFFMVHAVGGGGGASNVTGSGSATNSTDKAASPYSRGQVNKMPDWAKNAMGAGYFDGLIPPYSVERSGPMANITYGHAGTAGETNSWFFPNLTNVQIKMTPGLGGAIGADGEDTLVEFYETDPARPEVAAGDVIATFTAEGGTAGNGSGNMQLWLDGDNSLCDIKDLPGRKMQVADFVRNIETDIDTFMETKMPLDADGNVLAGNGGAGSYGNPAATGTVTYIVKGMTYDETDLDAVGTEQTNEVPSNVIKKPKCLEPTTCDDGSNGTVCPATAGYNGAVVILW